MRLAREAIECFPLEGRSQRSPCCQGHRRKVWAAPGVHPLLDWMGGRPRYTMVDEKGRRWRIIEAVAERIRPLQHVLGQVAWTAADQIGTLDNMGWNLEKRESIGLALCRPKTTRLRRLSIIVSFAHLSEPSLSLAMPPLALHQTSPPHRISRSHAALGPSTAGLTSR